MIFSLSQQAEMSPLDLLLLKEERLVSHKSEIFIIHDLLCASDKKHTTRNQRLVKFRIDLILCLIREIDHHIAADDQVTA